MCSVAFIILLYLIGRWLAINTRSAASGDTGSETISSDLQLLLSRALCTQDGSSTRTVNIVGHLAADGLLVSNLE